MTKKPSLEVRIKYLINASYLSVVVCAFRGASMTAKDDIFTTDVDMRALMICTPSDRLYISSACYSDVHQLATKK